MVVLNRIYTRTGDDGTTALGSGERRPKYDLRIAAYGTVDETNAADLHKVSLELMATTDEDILTSPGDEHEVIGDQPMAPLDEVQYAL